MRILLMPFKFESARRRVASMQGLTAPDFFRVTENTPRIDQLAYLGTE
jgi:hypothetical protein